MLIEKVSQLSGNKSIMELDVTQEQLELYATGTKNIQDVFPNLSPSEREFLMTGITPNEWDGLFGGM